MQFRALIFMSINTILILLGSIWKSATPLSMDYNKLLYLNKLT